MLEILAKASEEAGINLSGAMLEKFQRYYELLIEWNSRINLTAITDPEGFAVKHIIDSLTAFDEKIFFDGMTAVDVGTGAGFPGIPLKIFFPGIKLVLIDSLEKRINFLNEAVFALGLSDVDCVHARAEDAGRRYDLRESFDLALSRAVAQLSVLVEYALPLVRVGGSFLALKGAKYAEEIDAAKNAVRVLGGGEPRVRTVKLPGLNDARAVIHIKKTAPTPKKYPRKAGTPKKIPLGKDE